MSLQNAATNFDIEQLFYIAYRLAYMNLHSKRSIDNQSDDKIKLNDFLDAAAQCCLGIYFEGKKTEGREK